MLIYAIVLILVMLATNNEQLKTLIGRLKAPISRVIGKLKSLVRRILPKRKGAASNG